MLAGVLFSWNIEERTGEFFALYLALIGGVCGVFLSADVFLFFVFYEIAIVPKYTGIARRVSTAMVKRIAPISARFGSEKSSTGCRYAAMRFGRYCSTTGQGWRIGRERRDADWLARPRRGFLDCARLRLRLRSE